MRKEKEFLVQHATAFAYSYQKEISKAESIFDVEKLARKYFVQKQEFEK